ncbi:hypothetical protein SKAU_G00293300 [Synaphobranchus kaupii]|uniref:Uncharacterized protein n=1 Tax=Synaphobranchus kaupii TaxID=118154 RepID=A0A9Q1EU72_SYNKA|nr:hypothetical protein SKAU_G00293300 [Synaphobranchus kaupii]
MPAPAAQEVKSPVPTAVSAACLQTRSTSADVQYLQCTSPVYLQTFYICQTFPFCDPTPQHRLTTCEKHCF